LWSRRAAFRRVVDTNSALVGRRLTDIGLQPERITKVGDDSAAIQAALGTALADAELVIIIGAWARHRMTRHGGRRRVPRPGLRRASTDPGEGEGAVSGRGAAIPKLAERQHSWSEAPHCCQSMRYGSGHAAAERRPNHCPMPGVPAEMKPLPNRSCCRGCRGDSGSSDGPPRRYGRSGRRIDDRRAVRTTLVKHGRVQCGFYPSAAALISYCARPIARSWFLSVGDHRALGNRVYEVGDASWKRSWAGS